MSQWGQRVELGRRLKLLRHQTGLTSKELAELAGLSQSKVSRMENARSAPSVDQIVAVASALRLNAATRRRLIELAQSSIEPVRINASRLQRPSPASVLELYESARTCCSFSAKLLPNFAQTTDYMVAAVRPGMPKSGTGLGQLLANKKRIGALSFLSSERMHVVGWKALTTPTLAPDLWLEQLRWLRRQLLWTKAGFAISRESPEPNPTDALVTTTFDGSIAFKEERSEWTLETDRQEVGRANEKLDAIAKTSVWDGQAVKLVEEQIRHMEITLDLRTTNVLVALPGGPSNGNVRP